MVDQVKLETLLKKFGYTEKDFTEEQMGIIRWGIEDRHSHEKFN